eukprot:gnl/MRDRNA2_/MRDRNA2_125624_c0_seq1.p1 gnl/MRDRNA2_/MRDRNA2_125624_c0~~gnl/MRDRNA2_/MRDRNA2_125624_c0_seq1.p1  ORF type:complete len:390 (+),score=96.58 gnl/MRDRNA2_/MRDRNA2_125624_c0_seq1:84-1253(+)
MADAASNADDHGIGATEVEEDHGIGASNVQEEQINSTKVDHGIGDTNLQEDLINSAKVDKETETQNPTHQTIDPSKSHGISERADASSKSERFVRDKSRFSSGRVSLRAGSNDLAKLLSQPLNISSDTKDDSGGAAKEDGGAAAKDEVTASSSSDSTTTDVSPKAGQDAEENSSTTALSQLDDYPLSSQEDGVVRLNVYDLFESVSSINSVLDESFGTGAFHVGVEVYGVEYMYSGVTEETAADKAWKMLGYEVEIKEEDRAPVSGVLWHLPRQHEVHVYKETIVMGKTQYSMFGVDRIVQELELEYTREAYSLIRNNCVHFANGMCMRLGVGEIPPRLHGASSSISNGLDSMYDLPSNMYKRLSSVSISDALWGTYTEDNVAAEAVAK